MSELWLVAHKVRGEAAFDVAERMGCPECGGSGLRYETNSAPTCIECDGLGYWWIIPTSGHRAYPSDYIALYGLRTNTGVRATECLDMPTNDTPDHYAHRQAPSQLDSLLALIPSKPAPQMKRRL